MTELWAVGLRIIGTFIIATAALLMKKSSLRFQFFLNFKLISKNMLLIFSLFLYGLASVFSIIAYKGGELSVLLPINSLSFVWSIILAKLYLDEKLTINKYIGIMIIIIGIFVIVQ